LPAAPWDLSQNKTKSTASTTMKAIIIGGGMGGLTAAIALQRRGIDAQVYERSQTLRDVGAGVSLWPNAVKALRKLGLGQLLQSVSLSNVDSALRRSDGTFLSRLSALELERRFGGGMAIVHRAELLDLLAISVGFANIHLGHDLAAIDTNAPGVSVSFTNAASAHGDVLVGADGLHSAVRRWLGHLDRIRYSGYTAWRSVVSFDHSRLLPAETWGPGKRFGAFPLTGDLVYWFATANAPEGEHDSDSDSQSHLLSLFAGWHEPIEALIQAANNATILHNDIYYCDPLAEWGRGRVTLLGDAAHAMTPDLGQGACQAIEDALQLATCLACETKPELGLEQYEKTRIARTSPVVLASRRLGRMAQLEDPLLCRLRDALFELTPSVVTYQGLRWILGYQGHLAD
jgi:2-polyprenyl-6-methoxyphenol hydroxylase-like FAD-dependent oxidoreductase